jgi:hypothetical protein
MSEKEVPGQKYWTLIEPAWDSLTESWDEGPVGFLRRYRAFEPYVGHLFAAHWCQSEVCNGGFYQFFSNTTGILAPEALEGFRAIGLTEWAELLSEAMKKFSSPYPRQREVRQVLVPSRWSSKGKVPDPFRELDDKFFAWLHAEPDRWRRAADAYAVVSVKNRTEK